MKIKQVNIYHIEAPLKTPFGTSYGTYRKRESIILELIDESGEIGWGEAVAFTHPWYTEETIRTVMYIVKTYLIPMLENQHFQAPSDFLQASSWLKGHNMAKAAIEMGLWDLYAKLNQQPLYRLLGGGKNEVEVGVVVGLSDETLMLRQIEQYALEGYKRFKVKIGPGKDLSLLHTIRQHFPTIPLMVDANSAYSLKDVDHLKELDEFQLMMIEQPFGDRDFVEHSLLQKELTTPICLDESIFSLDDVKTANALGSGKIVNIKSGRVGGLCEAIAIHDFCLNHHIPVWGGGMLEFGVSRLQNLALATLPNFTIPADLSASSRYFEEDIIEPAVEVKNGIVTLSEKPGIGVEIRRDILREYEVERTT